MRRYGRYRLLFHLATGGMAKIYLARAAGPGRFEKFVVIKEINEHLSTDPAFIKMFKDEARLAARIAHPNVAHVIELGEVGENYFIAMEYVEGESLNELIVASEVPMTISARIMADALAGLHAAHELRDAQGELLHVVHRDLSPSNVLISYEGSVKVVDFGVAKALDNINITQAGTVKGKFAYMSPEQISEGELDRRADIFTAGILLFELTTRRNLFKTKSKGGTVSKILAGQVPPPSTVIEGYPKKLEAITMRALQVDPARRYQTAREMQEDLEAFIYSAGAPVTEGKVGTLMKRVFARRSRQKKELLRQAAEPTDRFKISNPGRKRKSTEEGPGPLPAPLARPERARAALPSPLGKPPAADATVMDLEEVVDDADLLEEVEEQAPAAPPPTPGGAGAPAASVAAPPALPNLPSALMAPEVSSPASLQLASTEGATAAPTEDAPEELPEPLAGLEEVAERPSLAAAEAEADELMVSELLAGGAWRQRLLIAAGVLLLSAEGLAGYYLLRPPSLDPPTKPKAAAVADAGAAVPAAADAAPKRPDLTPPTPDTAAPDAAAPDAAAPDAAAPDVTPARAPDSGPPQVTPPPRRDGKTRRPPRKKTRRPPRKKTRRPPRKKKLFGNPY